MPHQAVQRGRLGFDGAKARCQGREVSAGENFLRCVALCSFLSNSRPSGFAELLACHWQGDCVFVHAFFRVLVSLLIFLESSVFKTVERKTYSRQEDGDHQCGEHSILR